MKKKLTGWQRVEGLDRALELRAAQLVLAHPRFGRPSQPARLDHLEVEGEQARVVLPLRRQRWAEVHASHRRLDRRVRALDDHDLVDPDAHLARQQLAPALHRHY